MATMLDYWREQRHVGLLRLDQQPYEILSEICKYLRPSCTAGNSPSSINSHQRPVARAGSISIGCDPKDLRSLSFVCRRLRTAAQPHTLHHFHHWTSLTWHGCPSYRRILRLLRTLRDRPDLQPNLTLLDLPSRWWEALVNEVPEPTAEEVDLAKSLCVQFNMDYEETDFRRVEMDETALQLLFAMLPGVIDVRLTLRREWTFRLLDWTDFDSHGESPKPLVLGKVRRLVLHDHGLHLDACHDGHVHCNKMAYPSILHTIILGRASRSIEMLCCLANLIPLETVFERLTHLRFTINGTLPRSYIESVLARLPRLTHLSWNMVNQHGLTPKSLQAAVLSSHQDTLEYFSASMTRPMHTFQPHRRFTENWGTTQYWAPPANPDFIFDSFSKFKRLRTLALDDWMVWDDDVGDPVTYHYLDTGGEVNRDMTDFLPPTLETLCLTYSGEEKQAPILTPCITDVVKGLPTLRQLIVLGRLLNPDNCLTVAVEMLALKSWVQYQATEGVPSVVPAGTSAPWLKVNVAMGDMEDVGVYRRDDRMFPDWAATVQDEMERGVTFVSGHQVAPAAVTEVVDEDMDDIMDI